MSYFPPTGSTVAFQSNPSSLLVGASIIGLTPVSPTPSSVYVVNPVSTLSITTGNTSVTVNNIVTGQSSVQVLNPVSLLAVTQGTSPWVVNVPTPSYITYQAAGSVLAVRMDSASVVARLINSSVAVLQGTTPWIVNMPSPSVVATQIAGSLLGTQTYTGVSSVQLMAGTNNAGSITAIQGTTPWITTIQTNSIAGTYAEDSAHTTGSNGLFVLQVRNDTMSSVTSADGDYSAIAGGPIGETIIANSPITAWWQADTSIMANVSVQAKAGAGASIFTYVTGVQITNVSPNNVYITFTGGLGGKSSVLGYAPAPANGGAVFPLPNAWKTGANMGVSASVSGMGSILLSMQGFTAKI